MNLEAGKEMDRKCVLDWLNEVYVTPSRAFDEYTEDELKMFAHDAIALLEAQESSWISVPHKKARICSRCYADEPYKFADEDADVYDYCPNCGARMINRR